MRGKAVRVGLGPVRIIITAGARCSAARPEHVGIISVASTSGIRASGADGRAFEEYVGRWRTRAAEVTKQCSAMPQMNGRHCSVTLPIAIVDEGDDITYRVDYSESDPQAVRFGLLGSRDKYRCSDLWGVTPVSAWKGDMELCDVGLGPAAGMRMLLMRDAQNTTVRLFTREYVAHDGDLRKILSSR